MICGRATLSQSENDIGSVTESTPSRLGNEDVTFKEPWEAQALALSMALQRSGFFTPDEWSRALGAQIKSAHDSGVPDDGTRYYHHLLAALEGLVHEKGAATRDNLTERRQRWEEAYRNTPHGQPVSLPNDPSPEVSS